MLKQDRVTCHNERAKVGGLALDSKDVDHVAADAATWEKVVRKIRTGMMPPSGARRPERSVLDGFAAELETRLDQAAPVGDALHAPALHRLNRTEYANAIRDLLALDVDVKALLPSDASSEGFDNIAEALAVSPSLVQGYVSAAMKISRRAVGDRTATPSQITYSPPGGLAQDRHIDGLPLGTRGGMLVTHTFPLDAEYELSVGGGFAGGRGGGAGGPALDVTLDGEKIAVENPRSFRIKVTAGPHTIGAALVDRQRAAGVDDQFSDFRIDSVFTPAGGVGTHRDHRPVQRHRRRRHAEPSSHLRLPSGERRAKRGRARGRSSRRSRTARIAARCWTMKSKRCWGSISRAAATATSNPASSMRSRASWSPRASCTALKKSPKASVPARPTASAISSWRPACRSSCGAAFPTTNCSTWRARAGCAIGRCWANR